MPAGRPNKDARLELRLTPEDKDAFTEIVATEHGLTASKAIRLLLDWTVANGRLPSALADTKRKLKRSDA